MGSEGVLNMDGTTGTYDEFFTNVVTSSVVPARRIKHPEMVNPSHLDHLHMDRYVPILFFYQLPDNASATYEGFANRMKSSLAETLVAFYPMAGRVLKTKDLDHPRQLLFNDLGVPFSEAFINVEMGSFFNLQSFQPVGFLSGFEPTGLDSFKQVQDYHEEGNPAFFVQVTRFNCGGVVFAITWNHLIADMTGAVQFLTAWSETSRTGSTSIVPEHDRSVLIMKDQQSSIPASASPAPPPAAVSISTAEGARIQQVLQSKYIMRTLHVRKEAINKVKREAVKEYPEVSTMDCLCAHLWRSLANVYVKCGVTDVTVFTTAVEGRSRMGVSPFYFGNVIASIPITGVPSSELASKPVSYAASLIRKAIRGVTQDSYWSIIKQMDLRNPWKTGVNRTDYQLGVTSWIRFGLNDLDFGFGKPTFVGLNLLAQNARKGQCLVLPSPLGAGNFYVIFYLTPDILETLWAEPDFLSISEPDLSVEPIPNQASRSRESSLH